jgi:hypothetical protein
MQSESVYCVECICGHHIESATSTLICPGCQRLVVIEWPTSVAEYQASEQVEHPVAA